MISVESWDSYGVGMSNTSKPFALQKCRGDITCSDTDFRVEGYKLKDMEVSKVQANNKKKLKVDLEVHNSLEQEIVELEKRLKDQLAERYALETASGYKSSAIDPSTDGSTPEPTMELIREISVLELEVMHLEQYLLSLYRKVFDQKFASLLTVACERTNQTPRSLEGSFRETQLSKSDRMQLPEKLTSITSTTETCAAICNKNFDGPGIQRSHSELSYRSTRMSSPPANLIRALQSFHSQPLSLVQDEENAVQGIMSLAEHLGTNIADHVPETPNRISENMVHCMGLIYCNLVDPPLMNHELSSPTSSFSSASALSPQYQGEMWSPYFRKEPILDSRLINPFRVEGLKEFSGPYNSMVEVSFISRDNQRLRNVQDLLQNFQSLVRRLESMNPRRMNSEEKLAFWINIHNAMMMHAYLNHGIPQSNMKRNSSLTKETYNIGGLMVNADMIWGSILGCYSQSSTQWLKALVSPRMKMKFRNDCETYALDRQEPLLHFALCAGRHSDPAVRIYTPKRLFSQLETAKEEYIRAVFGIRNENKIVLPEIVSIYAKEKGLSSQGLIEMIQRYLPETLRMAMQKCKQRKPHKIIEWVPHNFTFRYLLSKELTIPH